MVYINYNINYNINPTIARLHSHIYNIKTKLIKTELELIYYKNKWKSIEQITPSIAIPITDINELDNSILIYIESLKEHIKILNNENIQLKTLHCLYNNSFTCNINIY